MTNDPTDCPTCFGTGNDPTMQPVQRYRKLQFRPCPYCGGTGKKPPPPTPPTRPKPVKIDTDKMQQVRRTRRP